MSIFTGQSYQLYLSTIIPSRLICISGIKLMATNSKCWKQNNNKNISSQWLQFKNFTWLLFWITISISIRLPMPAFLCLQDNGRHIVLFLSMCLCIHPKLLPNFIMKLSQIFTERNDLKRKAYFMALFLMKLRPFNDSGTSVTNAQSCGALCPTDKSSF